MAGRKSHAKSQTTFKLGFLPASKADAFVAKQLQEARKRVLKHGYRVWLYFVTLGNVSEATRSDADTHARAANATLDVIDGKQATRLFRDYLDGVAPPIPALDLEMENTPNVTVNGVAQRYDNENQVESWVFSMRGDAIGRLYDFAGIRLFARNVRGFVGADTPINRGMVATLQKEPNRFFYYNNGITILCDEAVKKSNQGKDILHVRNPQVINGQQTTRTLASHPEQAARASVLVKVIQVADRVDGTNGFDRLVTRIVAGTNWQNPIRASDLMANDRIQIDLERYLRRLGYSYIRKRQTKAEAKQATTAKHYWFVKKEEFAQVTAACELDPVVARTSREKLFEEQTYQKVFPNSDPNFFLPRWWVLREVNYCARKSKQRKDPRWLVIHFVWSELASHVRSARNARAFRILCEQQSAELVVPLNRAIDRVFVAALTFYRANKNHEGHALDVATFFKSKRASAKSFHEFWRTSPKCHGSFAKHIASVASAIATFDMP